MTNYDVAIIGGGPGGYVAAIRAAQLGFKTVCIDKRETLGGTCLNVGCIPSKVLLSTSHKYADASKSFKGEGIEIKDLAINVKTMQEHKSKIVAGLTSGISFLFKKNKVEHLVGTAFIKSAGVIEVSGKEKSEITAKHIIIATGSVPTSIPGVTIDEKMIVSSTGALDFDSLPKKLVVIGGGVIGLELGSVWSRLGSDVTVIEYGSTIVPSLDEEITKTFTRILKKQGLEIKTSMKVLGVEVKGSKATVTAEPVSGGEKVTFECDKVLVSAGRRPFTDGLFGDALGIKKDARGFIEVNDKFKTSIDGVYAIGDVIAGPMLAHKAEEDGVACIEALAGLYSHVDYNLVPGVIYTHPEVASIGQTEQSLKSSGIEFKTGSFPIMANSRSKAINETDGLVKIITDLNDVVLGASIISTSAGEIIHEVGVIMGYGGTSEDIFRVCHAHPTVSEALKEAALAVHGRAIHS